MGEVEVKVEDIDQCLPEKSRAPASASVKRVNIQTTPLFERLLPLAFLTILLTILS